MPVLAECAQLLSSAPGGIRRQSYEHDEEAAAFAWSRHRRRELLRKPWLLPALEDQRKHVDAVFSHSGDATKASTGSLYLRCEPSVG